MSQSNKTYKITKTTPTKSAVPSNHILEAEKPLSKSIIWKLQSDFYQNQGPEAWIKGIVPQYITTNPYIANLYAKTVLGYCRDLVSSEGFDKTTTIYICELAAGVGRFTYTFLKRFLTMVERSSLKGLKFKYLITDLAERNVEYWLCHSYLKPYFEGGILDCATFDMSHDTELTLRYSGEVLRVGLLHNPLILFANYTFDSLPQDSFYVKNHELFEGLISVTSPKGIEIPKAVSASSIEKQASWKIGDHESVTQILTSGDMRGDQKAKPVSKDNSILSGLDYEYRDNPISGVGYYEEDKFNDILLYYKDILEDTAFSFPIIALQCINRLKTLFNDDILLISSDKGYRNLASMNHIYHPFLSKHGSISLTVNFHAMELYFQSIGGKALHSICDHENVTMSMFLLSNHSHSFVETTMAYQEIVEHLGPDDFYIIKKAIVPYHKSFTTKELLTFLRYTVWDARTFLEFYNTLLERIGQEEDFPQNELVEVIHSIWENYFPIGEEGDLASCLASILAYFGEDKDAIALFQASLEFYGEDAAILYEIALCYYNLQEFEIAKIHLDNSLLINPDFEESLHLKSVLLDIC